MAYRSFQRPSFATGTHSTTDWMNWMRDEGDILVPVAPHHESSCDLCHGAVGLRYDGSTWPLCQHCQNYQGAVDQLIPITYSLDSGLESMLHRFKDRGVDWLSGPLSALLYSFLRRQRGCVGEAANGVDVSVVVPSDNRQRSFHPMDRLIHGGVEGDPVAQWFDWDFEMVERDFSTTRPARGELKPEAYRVTGDVADASVLVLDDTWTSGSSTASVAAALKDAGADRVTVLTLGRQLNANHNWGSSQTIFDDRHEAKWTTRECIVCV